MFVMTNTSSTLAISQLIDELLHERAMASRYDTKARIFRRSDHHSLETLYATHATRHHRRVFELRDRLEAMISARP